MLERQRRDVAALALRERQASVRVERARDRLQRARVRFLANPVNLLLPFTAGALGGAFATRRRATGRGRERRRERTEWGALMKTATTLWGLSLPLREALLDARATAVSDAAERTDAPETTSPPGDAVPTRAPYRRPPA